MPDRDKYIEVLSKTAKAVKELNKDAPIKISLKCIEDILQLLKEHDRLMEEARDEGYNEAYHEYCVEVAEEDEEVLRYAVEQNLKDAEVDVDLLEEQEKVILCKECKYFQEGIDIDGKPFTMCNCKKRKPTMTWGAEVTPDWFCGHAEAKEGERDG